MKKFTIALFCIFTLMILSCGGVSDGKDFDTESVNHSLEVSLLQERMFNPVSMDGLKWNISLLQNGLETGKVAEPSETGAKWTFRNLNKGSYEVKASGVQTGASIDGVPLETELLTGTAPVVIGDEFVQSVLIPVSVVKAVDGKGTVTIKLPLSADLLKAVEFAGLEFCLTNIEDENLPPYKCGVSPDLLSGKTEITVTNFSGNGVSDSLTNLNNGYYKLDIYTNGSDLGDIALLLNDAFVEVGKNTNTDVIFTETDYSIIDKNSLVNVYVNNAGTGDGSVYSKAIAFKDIKADVGVLSSKLYYLLEDITDTSVSPVFNNDSIIKPFGSAAKTITAGSMINFGNLELDNLILNSGKDSAGGFVFDNSSVKNTVVLNGKVDSLTSAETTTNSVLRLDDFSILKIGPNFSGNLDLNLISYGKQWKEGDSILQFDGITEVPAGGNINIIGTLADQFFLGRDGKLKVRNLDVEISQAPFKIQIKQNGTAIENNGVLSMDAPVTITFTNNNLVQPQGAQWIVNGKAVSIDGEIDIKNWAIEPGSNVIELVVTYGSSKFSDTFIFNI